MYCTIYCVCVSLKISPMNRSTTPLSVLRAQVLLSDYTLALLSIMKKKGNDSSMSLPETLSIVFELVQRPLTNTRGQGSMVVIRCHSRNIGTDMFNKLRAVRNTLGLQCRFEMILDHGEEKLTISDHFLKRLKSWGVAEGGTSLSYLNLKHLPCLVIMTGRMQSSVRLPR